MAKRKLQVEITGDAKGAAKAAGDTESRFGKLQGKMQDIGKKVAGAMAIAGGAAVAMFVGGAITAMGQSDLASGFSASLGLTDEWSAEYGKVAGDAYAQGFGESMAEVAGAVEAIHLSIDDAMEPDMLQDMTEQALSMAEAFKVDMNEAVAAAGAMLKNGLVADGQEAFDLLTVGMQGVPQAVREEILAGVNEYSKHFATLGISGSEAIAMFKSADGVIGVDKIGDALKEVTIRSTDMSKASTDAYEAMGLDAEKMSAKILAGGEVARGGFDEIVDGLLSIKDPTDQANTAIALFGTPIEDLGVDQIPTFLAGLSDMDGGLGDVGGAARKVADDLNSGPMKAFEKFKRQALQKTAEFIVNKAIPALSKITEWAKENKPVVIGIAAAIGVVLVAAFTAWAISAGAAAIATLAAVWPLLAIAAVIGLLVAGFLWAYENVDWFRQGVDLMAAGVTTAFQWVLDKVTMVFGWARDNWPLLLAILTGPIGLAVLAITTHWDTIKDGFTTVKDWISEKIGEIVGFFTGLPGSISTALSGLSEIIFGPIRSAMDWILDKVNSAVASLQSALDSVRGVGRVGGISDSVIAGIPKSHSGSVIPGGAADEVLRVLQGGEVVLDRGTVQNLATSGASSRRGASDGSGVTYVTVHVAGSVTSERDLVDAVADGLNRKQSRSARPILPGVA